MSIVPHIALLVLDLDGTLIASPMVDGENWSAWEASLRASDLLPVPGAQEGVRRLLFQHPRASFYLLTGRNDRLRSLTCAWVARHFPCLDGAIVSMRPDGSLLPSPECKGLRLKRIRDKYPGRMLLVDDDPAMRGHLGPADIWAQAPDCWTELAEKVA